MRVTISISNDADHRRALEQTGFWGKRAAGCVFLARDTGRYMFALRSPYVQEPNTWGTWGGALDDKETPQEAVLREIKEECKYYGKVDLEPLHMFSHPSGFKYHTFLAVVDREFVPVLDHENSDYRWVNRGDWPGPQHPGLKDVLKKLQTYKSRFVSTSNSFSVPKLKIDNPGGHWLESKRRYNLEDGFNRFNTPKSFGSITGSFSGPVLVPVEVLRSLKGARQEQSNVRQKDLKWLHSHMTKTGRLPRLPDGSDEVPYIEVWQDGTPYVNEGNHRIMAAHKGHFRYLPVNIRYFTGGEQEWGPLNPSRVQQYHRDALEEGYTLTSYSPTS